jgi:hypothetical protein
LRRTYRQRAAQQKDKLQEKKSGKQWETCNETLQIDRDICIYREYRIYFHTFVIVECKKVCRGGCYCHKVWCYGWSTLSHATKCAGATKCAVTPTPGAQWDSPESWNLQFIYALSQRCFIPIEIWKKLEW